MVPPTSGNASSPLSVLSELDRLCLSITPSQADNEGNCHSRAKLGCLTVGEGWMTNGRRFYEKEFLESGGGGTEVQSSTHHFYPAGFSYRCIKVRTNFISEMVSASTRALCVCKFLFCLLGNTLHTYFFGAPSDLRTLVPICRDIFIS